MQRLFKNSAQRRGGRIYQRIETTGGGEIKTGEL